MSTAQLPGLNIFVPLAGIGDRFLRSGYWRPKPFIKVQGKELLLWLLEGLSLTADDNIVFIFNKKPEVGTSPSNFFVVVDDYLSQLGAHKPNVTYVSLSEPTLGAAQTVLYGIEALSSEHRERPCVLLDGDTFYGVDILSQYRDLLQKLFHQKQALAQTFGGCLFVFEDDKPDESIYSYVKFAEDDADHTSIVGIKEKDKTEMSHFACSGCYCFHDTNALAREISSAILVFSQRSDRRLRELYTSMVVGEMLIKGGEFRALKLSTSDFHVLGTPSQVQRFIAVEHGVHKKRFCFDLDGTLVTAPKVPGDYASCEPIERIVSYIQKMHAEGHYIIIHTARRMRTHGGNVGGVLADVGLVTLTQLNRFSIPYDEIIFGKPFADFYIDDKAILPFVDELHKETGYR